LITYRAEEPTNMNLDVQMLFRDFKQMSEDDRKTLTEMAKLFAERSKSEKKDKS